MFGLKKEVAPMVKGINIAIDGPAGAGKSTIAKITAEQLRYTYIDTGAMYRALTHKALTTGIHIEDGSKLKELLMNTKIMLLPTGAKQAVQVDGEDVTEAIREPAVTAAVSTVAAHAEVREIMVEKQRELGNEAGVVMDGRDIGTSVLPHAELKVYMTATAEERALRRFKENQERGIDYPLEQLTKEINERDRADMERESSPLKQAEDAVFIDTTFMTIEEVVDEIIRLAKERV